MATPLKVKPASSPKNGEAKVDKRPAIIHIGVFKLKNKSNKRAVFIDLQKAIGFPVRMVYIQKDTNTNNKFNFAAVLSSEETKVFQQIQAQKVKKDIKVPTEKELKDYGCKK